MEAFFIGLTVVIIGLAFTFAGYQFFRILMPIWGFFAGFALGAQAVSVGFGDGFLATTTGWVVGLVVAVVFAILAYAFYELAVGILAAFLGYWVSYAILTQLGFSDTFLVTILSLAFGVMLGGIILYLNAPKGLLILFSSLSGATATVGGLLVLFGILPVDLLGGTVVTSIISESLSLIVVWVALIAGGIMTQVEISRALTAETAGYDLPSTPLMGIKGGTSKKTDNETKWFL